MLMAQGATTASNALSKTSVFQALQQQSQTNLLVLCVPVVPMCSLSIKIFQNNLVQTMLMAKGEKTNSNALPKHHVFQALLQQSQTKLCFTYLCDTTDARKHLERWQQTMASDA